MTSHATPVRRPIPQGALRHTLTHLLMPLLMCLGMGLAYLGAFHSPEPRELKVAVVGSGPQAQVLAQTLKDRAGDALDVRTLPSRDAAADALRHQRIYGAYLAAPRPELMVAKAGSDTTATAVQQVFTKAAAAQGAPLKVTDVAPLSHGDPTGQGIFFLLVALSIGSYASVAVIGGLGAVLPMWLRGLLGAGTGLVISLLGAAFAGPVFHLVDHDLAGVWAMAWLYSTGILWIGIGLHTFLKRFTTLAMTVLFVMLNFTSSGGIFKPDLQPGLFASLHAFWNGAGFVEGARSLVYFDSLDLGGHVLVLALWAAAGLGMLALARLAERGRTPAAPAPAEAEQEIEETVPA
ncbi:hypothetical protein [Actinomadura macrotermitis]|uniref:ABC transporter permease n=1 Tax=Actinomadura macrotermitis TaxID=2585200 RepID=A0A7K0C7N9_9ACTN|nr:hypothetical protein [Actinomadura macrotermitis]MQY09467.1 hypothetical protein [Actinomadura macrotermitis]